MGILEKISEIEKEIARTQKNKGERGPGPSAPVFLPVRWGAARAVRGRQGRRDPGPTPADGERPRERGQGQAGWCPRRGRGETAAPGAGIWPERGRAALPFVLGRPGRPLPGDAPAAPGEARGQ